MKKKSPKAKKIKIVMEEFKDGTLHSGSKKGPTVKNRKQAIAIALSEGDKASKKKKKTAKRGQKTGVKKTTRGQKSKK